MKTPVDHHWAIALLLALAAEVALIAALVIYMAVWGNAFHPGQPAEFYRQHAQAAGPWVSILTGIPLFFFLSRWLSRRNPPAIVVLLGGFWFLLDFVLLLASGGPKSMTTIPGFWAASCLIKFAAIWAGTRMN